MAYVITEPCLGTCDISCVKICPVDCIHGPKSVREVEKIHPKDRKVQLKTVQMFIDPDACIDCAACEPVCPVKAIFEKSEVPQKWHSFIDKNDEYFKKHRRPF